MRSKGSGLAGAREELRVVTLISNQWSKSDIPIPSQLSHIRSSVVEAAILFARGCRFSWGAGLASCHWLDA
jgi:hypothetical protein